MSQHVYVWQHASFALDICQLRAMECGMFVPTLLGFCLSVVFLLCPFAMPNGTVPWVYDKPSMLAKNSYVVALGPTKTYVSMEVVEKYLYIRLEGECCLPPLYHSLTLNL